MDMFALHPFLPSRIRDETNVEQTRKTITMPIVSGIPEANQSTRDIAKTWVERMMVEWCSMCAQLHLKVEVGRL
jgi:hypothetical protein